MEVTRVGYNSTEGEYYFVPATSPAMRALERVVADIAATDIPVLLAGEGGTGKEVVAHRIHQLSLRHSKPFVKLICALLTPETAEDLFRPPRNDGESMFPLEMSTVFLDEVSELDAGCQPRLLHALFDENSGSAERGAGARVISSTRKDLWDEMRGGRFREDLCYRLTGVCLRLPRLRERTEDIPALVDFFLRKYAGLLGRSAPSLGSRTLRMLLDYSWPGNIRELENTVRKIVALGDERAVTADLGPTQMNPPGRSEAGTRLSLKEAARTASRQAERELILKVLTRTRWNRKRAAQQLQISYKALLYKLKQLGLDSSDTL